MASRKPQLARAASSVAVLLLVAIFSSSDSKGTPGIITAASTQQADLQDIMRRKLEYSQGLLRAVVLGEHVLVEQHANELTLLSEASTWTPMTTPQYLRYAADFRETAERLKEEAQNRNMERVAFAYTELVTTCVQCHRHVRGAQLAN